MPKGELYIKTSKTAEASKTGVNAAIFKTAFASVKSACVSAIQAKAEEVLYSWASATQFDGFVENATLTSQSVTTYDGVVFDTTRRCFLAYKGNQGTPSATYHVNFSGIADYARAPFAQPLDKVYRYNGAQYQYDGTTLVSAKPTIDAFVSSVNMLLSALPVIAEKVGNILSGDNGWVDAYERYGLSLGDGAIDKLMAVAPHKQPQGTSISVRHGKSYNWKNIGLTDERQVSFEVNMTASDKSEYLARYAQFNEEVLNIGIGEFVMMRLKYTPGVTYCLVYQGMEPLRQWISGGLAIFTLQFNEPHPELQEVYPDIDGQVVEVVTDDSKLIADLGEYEDGDMAIVTNPAIGKSGNYAIRTLVADGGEASWEDDSDKEADNGEIWRNKRTGELWRYIRPTSQSQGEWEEYDLSVR